MTHITMDTQLQTNKINPDIDTNLCHSSGYQAIYHSYIYCITALFTTDSTAYEYHKIGIVTKLVLDMIRTHSSVKLDLYFQVTF